MAPRRPSTASVDTSSSRMPFATAEALLWGPELRQQHAYLLTEMRALQKQHEAYDARIRTTEAATEAAEAATSRIRNIEQQLAAIEAEENDKVFEKWAAEEITRLKVFVDTHKDVRPQQIELAKDVSTIADDLDKLRDIPIGLKGLFRRLEHLEIGRQEDTQRIQSLERELAGVKTMLQNKDLRVMSPRVVPKSKQGSHRAMTPPHLQSSDASDASSETEDERMVLPQKPTSEHVQVPRSPEVKEKSTSIMRALPPTQDRPVTSARHRLFKRPSIHNSMLPRLMEEDIQKETPTSVPEPRVRRGPNPPPTQLVHRVRKPPASVHKPRPGPKTTAPTTQLVNKASPRKRKQPDDDAPTQRVTRAQVKKTQERESEQLARRIGNDMSTLSTQLVDKRPSPHKKPRIAPIQRQAQSKVTSGQATHAIPRSPKKTQQPQIVAGSGELALTEATQANDSTSKKPNITNPVMSLNKMMGGRPTQAKAQSPSKQKQLVVVLPQRFVNTQVDHIDDDHLQMSAADRVKMSPRKAANIPSFKVLPKPSSSRKMNIHTNPAAGPNGDNGNKDNTQSQLPSSTRTMSPNKPRTGGPSNDAAPPPPSATSRRSRRRAIPEVQDLDAFLKLQAKGESS